MVCWTQYTKLEDIEELLLELSEEEIEVALRLIKPKAE